MIAKAATESWAAVAHDRDRRRLRDSSDPTPDGTSIAQQAAKGAPASAHVIKAFNAIFGNVLARGGPLDVFMAGDDAQAKASLPAFIGSMGLRPLDTGDLTMAHWLEGAGLLMMGLGRYGVGNYGFSLGINNPG